MRLRNRLPGRATIRQAPTNRIVRSIEYRLRHGWFSHIVREVGSFQAYVYGPADRVTVGEGTDIRGATLNSRAGRIEFGKWCFVGHEVRFLTGTHFPHLRMKERYDVGGGEGRDIIVGDGVWFATGAIIIGPCRIGDHAVIAAGSVVTKDVEAETIVGGVPARFIRKC